MDFTSDEHMERFHKVWIKFQRKTPGFVSAVFLLTSYRELWERTRKCITLEGEIDFSKAEIRGIPVPLYALYMTAKDLYTENEMVSVFALTDSAMIPNRLIRLIETAVLIRRDCLHMVKKIMP